MMQKFKSRKFIAALVGALMCPILAYVAEDMALAEACQISAGILASYIFGQGYVDGKAAEAAKG